MLLFLAACGLDKSDSAPAAPPDPCDPTAEPVCSCAPPTLTIGDGGEVFTPLHDGQDHTVVHGPQGGWHLLASVSLTNTAPFVILEYTIDTLPDMTRVSYNLYNVQLPIWADCAGQLTDIFGYLEVSALAVGELNTPPELLIGREMRITINATDIDGRTTSASVDVVGQLDAIDVPGAGDSGGADSASSDSGRGDTAVSRRARARERRYRGGFLEAFHDWLWGRRPTTKG